MEAPEQRAVPGRPPQPRLWTALLEDARVTSAMRGEPHELVSRPAALWAMVRLAVVSDAFLGQALYRAAAALRRRGVPVLPRLAQRLAIASAAIYVGDGVRLQPGVYIVHGQVVLQGRVEVGRGVTISPAVTVAAGEGPDDRIAVGPGASLGTGSRVLGSLSIGPRARVGAGSVVLGDVPAGATAVGVPARIVSPAPD